MRCLPSPAVLPSLTKHQSMQWLTSLLSRQLITSDTALPSSYQLFLFLNHCIFMKKKNPFPFFFFFQLSGHLLLVIPFSIMLANHVSLSFRFTLIFFTCVHHTHTLFCNKGIICSLKSCSSFYRVH